LLINQADQEVYYIEIEIGFLAVIISLHTRNYQISTIDLRSNNSYYTFSS